MSPSSLSAGGCLIEETANLGICRAERDLRAESVAYGAPDLNGDRRLELGCGGGGVSICRERSRIASTPTAATTGCGVCDSLFGALQARLS
jgi:hypothetical protein